MKKQALSILTIAFCLCAIFYLRGARDQETHQRRILSDLQATFCVKNDVSVNRTEAALKISSLSADITARLQKYRGKNRLPDALKSNDFGSYGGSLVFPSIVWFIGLIIIVIGCATCYWCCICECCNCCTCRDYNQRPITDREKLGWFIAFVIFGLLQAGFAIAVIIVVPQMTDGGRQTTCGLALLLDDLNNGANVTLNASLAGYNRSYGVWIGLTKGVAAIGTVEQAIRDAPNKISGTTDASTSAIDQDYTAMKNKLNSMYNTYKDKTLSNPDPNNKDGTQLTTPVLTTVILSSPHLSSLVAWTWYFSINNCRCDFLRT